MRRRVIRVGLNPASIAAAIKAIEDERRYMLTKAREVAYRLADIGVQVAQVGFDTAFYQGDHYEEVEVQEVDGGNGFLVVARGEKVCFIEFGAGVFYNGDGAYPANKPVGVVGIGEYGKGQGAHDGWVFYDGDEKIFTRGNPAAMPMWFASQEIKQQAKQIVREVFAS